MNESSTHREEVVRSSRVAAPPLTSALEICPTTALVLSAATGRLIWANQFARDHGQVPNTKSLCELVPEGERAALAAALAALPELASLDVELTLQPGFPKTFTVLRTLDCFVAIDQLRASPRPRGPLDDAARDPLTGLLHRAALDQWLSRTIQGQSAEWGILFIDLDNYKQVNDRHGHLVGDDVLRQFAERLRAGARPTDFVFRFGGDEFVVLVDHVSTTSDLERMADRIRRSIFVDVAASESSPPIRVTASVGCALAWPQLERANQILDLADRDMYRRKDRNGAGQSA